MNSGDAGVDKLLSCAEEQFEKARKATCEAESASLYRALARPKVVDLIVRLAPSHPIDIATSKGE